jgi:hypothetical protein
MRQTIVREKIASSQGSIGAPPSGMLSTEQGIYTIISEAEGYRTFYLRLLGAAMARLAGLLGRDAQL